MKLFNHLNNTWLLAIMLYTSVMALLVLYHTDDLSIAIVGWFVLGIKGLLFSTPAYLFCLGLCALIMRLTIPFWSRLFIWALGAIVSLVNGLQLVLLMIQGNLNYEPDILLLSVPGILSLVLAIGIRHKQFFHLVKLYNEPIQPLINYSN